LKPMLFWKSPLARRVNSGFVCALVLVAICAAIWLLSAVVIPAVRP